VEIVESMRRDTERALKQLDVDAFSRQISSLLWYALVCLRDARKEELSILRGRLRELAVLRGWREMREKDALVVERFDFLLDTVRLALEVARQGAITTDTAASADRTRVLTMLAVRDEPMELLELATALGMDEGDVVTAVDFLRQNALVDVTGIPGQNPVWLLSTSEGRRVSKAIWQTLASPGRPANTIEKPEPLPGYFVTKRKDPNPPNCFHSRGIEHDLVEMEIDVPKGQTVRAQATMRRTIDTKGWIFHTSPTQSSPESNWVD